MQRVVMPGGGTESWTVLGEDDVPAVPVERFLAYLTSIERSPNTVKAYAHDLKDFLEFLGLRGLDWREVRLEDVGEFVAWLRLPPPGRAGAVPVLPSAVPQVGAATINRKLAAVSAFYAYQARSGAGVGDLLAIWQVGGRGGWKPFLHHVSKGMPHRGRAVTVKAPKKLPRILTVAETQAVLDGCTRLRDRFFFALLHETAAFSRGAKWTCGAFSCFGCSGLGVCRRGCDRCGGTVSAAPAAGWPCRQGRVSAGVRWRWSGP